MHSTVMPESAHKQPWNHDNTNLDDPPAGGHALWWNTANATFQTFEHGSSAAASFQTVAGRNMRRTARFLHPDPTRPVIRIEDRFPGTNTRNAPKVEKEGDGWRIRGEDFDLRLMEHGYVFESSARKVVTAFDQTPLEGLGCRLESGPAEAMTTGNDGWRVHRGETNRKE